LAHTDFGWFADRTLHHARRPHAEWEELQSISDGSWGPEQARGIVRALKFVGVEGLSLERRVPRDSYFALLDEAKREQLLVGGHIPIGVKPEEAPEAGQATIENADTLFEGMFTVGIPEDKIPAEIARFLASGAADKLFALFAKNKTAYTPALSQFEWSLRDADPAAPKDPRILRSPNLSASSSGNTLLLAKT
jgi:hypothetical protein